MSKCHDCGVGPGEFHSIGCDVERCPFCGGQLISCSCIYKQLGKRFGWEYKPYVIINPGDKIPEGYSVDSMLNFRDRGGVVYSYLYNGLPEDIFNGGPTDEMAELWGEMLEEQGRNRWTGKWPGEDDCERLGLWCVSKSGGFESVDKDYPGATHDLNRLYTDCEWNRKLKRFELREKV